MSAHIPPHLFTFQDGVLRPRWPNAVTRHYKEGERYLLVPMEERSLRSERHYFAALREAHLNLPEEASERLPSMEHLRKFALIKTGYSEQQQTVLETPEDARKMAAVLRQMDEYSIVVVQGNVVTRFVAKSQSRKAMGKKDFGESKQKVLDYVAGLVGVSKDELEKNAGAAA